MLLSEASTKVTAFITYSGLHGWTRVPIGIFSSANYFQQESLLEVEFSTTGLTMTQHRIDNTVNIREPSNLKG